MRISNFYVANSGKLVRSCGDCTGNGGPRRIFINNGIARDVPTTVGINSNFGDVAMIRNLTLNNSGTSSPRFVRCTKAGEGPGQHFGARVVITPNCQVGQGDVTLLPPSQMDTSACAGSCPIP